MCSAEELLSKYNMISPNLAEAGATRLPFGLGVNPGGGGNKTDTEKAAAAIKMTNFSIAAIMNSQMQRNVRKLAEDAEEEFEAKRRKLAEAVPALGKMKIAIFS